MGKFNISRVAKDHGFGLAVLGCAAVAGLHIWKRNSLLSIGGGTVLYMLLVQLVF